MTQTPSCSDVAIESKKLDGVAGASRDEQVQVPELIKTGRLNCPKYLFLLPRGGGEP